VEVQLQLVASSGSAPLPTPGTSGKPDTQTHRLSSRLAKWTKRPKNQTFRTLSVVVSGGKKELGQSKIFKDFGAIFYLKSCYSSRLTIKDIE